MRHFWLLGALGCASLFGQNPPDKPRFEVASIKPVTDGIAIKMSRSGLGDVIGSMMSGLPTSGNLVQIRNRSILSLIATAYRVKSTEVTGPAWMADQIFDIEARIPEGAPHDLANEMLQTLLEERFGLKLHHESKDLPGYDLVVGKNGPKLKESTPTDADAMQPSDNAKQALEMMRKKGMADGVKGISRQEANGVSSAQIANLIARLVHCPVIDKTNLPGNTTLSLKLLPTAPMIRGDRSLRRSTISGSN